MDCFVGYTVVRHHSAKGSERACGAREPSTLTNGGPKRSIAITAIGAQRHGNRIMGKSTPVFTSQILMRRLSARNYL